MSFEHWIALLGLIVSAASLLVTITGGILAILGYRKIIRSTDENAKERQAGLERAADTLQGMGQSITGSIKRDKYTVTVFMVLIVFGFFRIGQLVFTLRDRVKKLEQKTKYT